ncbi:uncharacterized protein LOC108669581 [Hyalella azteca]|uniref:Uncharacterized protein LOC108669581 n=1 Tax=Hyalella azteca TaxID=294128 RepID=A0A8B7NFQ8_HYAAZ|nr:uncharacterized protein LOC108669581 [Hyalella azteca]
MDKETAIKARIEKLRQEIYAKHLTKYDILEMEMTLMWPERVQRLAPDLLVPLSFHKLHYVLELVLQKPTYSILIPLSRMLIAILEGSIERIQNPKHPVKLSPAIAKHIRKLVSTINIILEIICLPKHCDGEVVQHTNQVVVFCSLFRDVLNDSIYKNSFKNEKLRLNATFHSNFLIHKLISSFVFASMVRGVFEKVGETLPVRRCRTVQELVESSVATDCAICADKMATTADYALLSSCMHTFCLPCSKGWFTDHYSCPICRAQNCFWISKTELEEYQKFCTDNMIEKLKDISEYPDTKDLLNWIFHAR